MLQRAVWGQCRGSAKAPASGWINCRFNPVKYINTNSTQNATARWMVSVWDHFFSLLFPKEIQQSKQFGYWTSGSWGKNTFKRYLKSEQTHWQTDRQTHIWTNRLIESIGPEGQCFENLIITCHKYILSPFYHGPDVSWAMVMWPWGHGPWVCAMSALGFFFTYLVWRLHNLF